MDGLIKGLVDVALGGNRNHHDDDNNDEQRDERSRSSWAEIVSGEEDRPTPQDHEDGEWKHQGSRISNTSYKQEEEQWQDDAYRTTSNTRPHQEKYHPKQGEWESESFHASNRPNKSDEDNNDGWQTVGDKHSRQQHKVPKDNWNQYKLPPDEQQYSNEVEVGGRVEPSEDELTDLSRASEKLWDLDLNRLVPGNDYEIDCGEGKKVFQKDDMAQGSLFTWVNDDVFRKPTFSRFLSLLDNYNPHQGSKEVVTSEERQEQASFIEEISRTAPIKYLHKYLASKGIASGSYQDFKRMMTSLWFDLYGRGGTSGSSSAFEHVFVGEIKQNNQVSGFHNWLQFYHEEANGRVDYQGYIFPRRRGEIPDSETQLLTIQFEWNGVLKSVSSTLIGVSPEFEVALYTLCFYAGEEDNHIQLGPYSVNIKCYHLGDRIGSVFPISDS
ncbi:PREDICTED: poly(U)-specific endoribonuclease-B-like isoform X2 [Lupinus angustifolius]|uniref:poly(U)-specific endoribonuclease-B-like isoform X2 n=1 Tax=Lupinus angustifolius TaxID=3871 RepID=UPI00092FB065|nr:PREDICTED: poly(U)-specific endoribonuclease-B-like isoform X2 [Lupinus angustifolius]